MNLIRKLCNFELILESGYQMELSLLTALSLGHIVSIMAKL